MNINTYNYYFSIGSNCRAANALRKLNMRKFSTTFDWGFSTPKSFYLAYLDNFQELTKFSLNKLTGGCSYGLLRPYHFNFMHDTQSDEATVIRRATRLKDTIENCNNKILLVYNHLPLHLMQDLFHSAFARTLIKQEGEDIFDLKYLELLKDELPDTVDVLVFHHEELNLKYQNVYYQLTAGYGGCQKRFGDKPDWDEHLIVEQLKNMQK